MRSVTQPIAPNARAAEDEAEEEEEGAAAAAVAPAKRKYALAVPLKPLASERLINWEEPNSAICH